MALVARSTATVVSVLLSCCSIFGLSEPSKLRYGSDGRLSNEAITNHLGDKDRAFGWLDKAYQERSYLMPFSGWYREHIRCASTLASMIYCGALDYKGDKCSGLAHRLLRESLTPYPLDYYQSHK